MKEIQKYYHSLAFFRICFGLLMMVAELRFIAKGWITDFYVKPIYFFSFYGFEWIKPLPEPFIYWVFYVLIFLSLLIATGLFYRIAIVLFFITFTYVELLDKSVYLNHYYQVSLLAFLMCFLPMNKTYSIDSFVLHLYKIRILNLFNYTLNPKIALWALRIQVGLVYFFGGIAKLKSDWLFEAQPLKIWLNSHTEMPVLGYLFQWQMTPFLFSWAGLIFDLSAAFLLCFSATRRYIYPVLVIFHILTYLLFNIGLFPWMMMLTALIFFESSWHQKVLEKCFPIAKKININHSISNNYIYFILIPFFTFQALMPFRSFLYKGNVLWHEQGFRFAWNIMLMEKKGFTEYRVTFKNTRETITVRPEEFLNTIQTKQMSFQPDMILQFAHFLHQYYLENNLGETEIKVDCFVTLNGKLSRLLVDPNIDLTKEKDNFEDKKWILP
ncbi:MAG: HTTM domain-containing protein [Pseudarcicella sp.]|nr:HTTM domain-containing protein [Pseudarcicella sp.]